MRLPREWEEGWHFESGKSAARQAMRERLLEEWWSGGSAPTLVVQGMEDVGRAPREC